MGRDGQSYKLILGKLSSTTARTASCNSNDNSDDVAAAASTMLLLMMKIMHMKGNEGYMMNFIITTLIWCKFFSYNIFVSLICNVFFIYALYNVFVCVYVLHVYTSYAIPHTIRKSQSFISFAYLRNFTCFLKSRRECKEDNANSYCVTLTVWIVSHIALNTCNL